MLVDTQGNFNTYHGCKHNKTDWKVKELKKEEKKKQVKIHRNKYSGTENQPQEED